MALYQSQIREIISRHTHGERRILTWRGWRKIKLLDKSAALREIYRAFGREFEEQRKRMERDIETLRREIVAARENSVAGLAHRAPRYAFEEIRVLFGELEKELSKKPTPPTDGLSQVLERIRVILEQDHENQLRVVDRAERDSRENLDNFRRRLERMAKDLRLSEEEVGRLRNELDIAYDGGVASIYKNVQGLPENETNVETKRDLLTKLFESNKELRKKID